MALVNTQISDLIVPAIFAGYIQEESSKVNKLVTSGAVTADPVMNEKIQSASGVNFHLPSLLNVSEDSAGYAVSSDDVTAIATPSKITGRQQIVPVLDRNFSWGSADLASHFAGVDPIRSAVVQAANKQIIERQKILLLTLKGVMAASSMSSHLNDVSVTDAATATAANKIGANTVIDTTAGWGDKFLAGGYMVMHSDLYRNLKKLNLISFQATNVQSLGWGTYLDFSVLVDDTCPKVATTNGYKYTTYQLSAGAIGFAAGTPKVPVELYRRPDVGNGGGADFLFIRDKLSFHIYGTSFTGTASGTNGTVIDTDLSTGSNWTAVFNSKLIGVTALITNG